MLAQTSCIGDATEASAAAVIAEEHTQASVTDVSAAWATFQLLEPDSAPRTPSEPTWVSVEATDASWPHAAARSLAVGPLAARPVATASPAGEFNKGVSLAQNDLDF